MGDVTEISWADATFNPWIGCMKTGSLACEGCYADALMGSAGRYKRATWGGPGQGVGTRDRTSASNWKKPLTWEKKQRARVEAWKRGDAPKPAPFFVFCASLADVFDNAVDPAWRRDLFDLIRRTPHLTWLLLTKRPQNIVKMFTAIAEAELGPYADEVGVRSAWPRNAALGCTVVTQAEANRDALHLMLASRALAPAFLFLSMEPLMERVQLTCLSLGKSAAQGLAAEWADVQAVEFFIDALRGAPSIGLPPIDWVITGGGTDQGGWKAPALDMDAVRLVRDECAEAGVAFQHKQNGEWLEEGFEGQERGASVPWGCFTDEGWVTEDGSAIGRWMGRVGKRRAGRLLDGVVHDARPDVPLKTAA